MGAGVWRGPNVSVSEPFRPRPSLKRLVCFPPPRSCRLPSNLGPPLGCQAFGSSLPAPQAAATSGIGHWRRQLLLNLPRRYPHDVDGVADDIGGALLAFRTSGHLQFFSLKMR